MPRAVLEHGMSLLRHAAAGCWWSRRSCRRLIGAWVVQTGFKGFPVVTTREDMAVVGYIRRQILQRMMHVALEEEAVRPDTPCIFSRRLCTPTMILECSRLLPLLCAARQRRRRCAVTRGPLPLSCTPHCLQFPSYFQIPNLPPPAACCRRRQCVSSHRSLDRPQPLPGPLPDTHFRHDTLRPRCVCPDMTARRCLPAET